MTTNPAERSVDDLSLQAHYFVPKPSVASSPILVEVALPDTTFVLETDRGVFSRGKLDPGTSLLLRSDIPLSVSGNLLDLGCGAGPIALAMARRAPEATVWAIDVNERALELTRKNADRNGLTNIQVAIPGDVPSTVRFATIWSNPPVRIGKRALRSLLIEWLDRMDAAGVGATFVVHKHLGADSLQRWLNEQRQRTERIGSKAGFRLLLIGPPEMVG